MRNSPYFGGVVRSGSLASYDGVGGWGSKLKKAVSGAAKSVTKAVKVVTKPIGRAIGLSKPRQKKQPEEVVEQTYVDADDKPISKAEYDALMAAGAEPEYQDENGVKITKEEYDQRMALAMLPPPEEVTPVAPPVTGAPPGTNEVIKNEEDPRLRHVGGKGVPLQPVSETADIAQPVGATAPLVTATAETSDPGATAAIQAAADQAAPASAVAQTTTGQATAAPYTPGEEGGAATEEGGVEEAAGPEQAPVASARAQAPAYAPPVERVAEQVAQGAQRVVAQAAEAYDQTAAVVAGPSSKQKTLVIAAAGIAAVGLAAWLLMRKKG